MHVPAPLASQEKREPGGAPDLEQFSRSVAPLDLLQAFPRRDQMQGRFEEIVGISGLPSDRIAEVLLRVESRALAGIQAGRRVEGPARAAPVDREAGASQIRRRRLPAADTAGRRFGHRLMVSTGINRIRTTSGTLTAGALSNVL